MLYDPSLVWNEETVLELRYFDFDGDNRLSDDERDEDADGLTNYDESHGPMLPAFWTGCYKKEKPYPVPYSATDLATGTQTATACATGLTTRITTTFRT